MICPACGNTMTEVMVGDIKVDACRGGCGGLWFDEWELRKVDEPTESLGEALLDVEVNPNVKVDPAKPRHCPRDPEIVMMQHLWSVKRQTTVDECPKCEGMFLDPGELKQIRAEYDTDEKRHEAARQYYSEMFDGELAEMAKADQATLARAHKIAHALRFICPSYYIPGKQAWGAF
jgi:Zn-finger nucleic acid-binding protein